MLILTGIIVGVVKVSGLKYHEYEPFVLLHYRNESEGLRVIIGVLGFAVIRIFIESYAGKHILSF